MIKNFLKTAWRSLFRNKLYSIINICGLAMGIGAAILIFSFIYYEKSFDNFHPGSDRIYRVVGQTTTKDGTVNFTPGSNLAFQKTLMATHAELGRFAPAHGMLGPMVSILGKTKESNPTSKKFQEEDEGLLVGPEFFDIFHYSWLQGKPQNLADPYVVVLTRRYAEKYFGSVNEAMGQFIQINNADIMQVVGVLENTPLNTDFPLNLVISYETKRRNPSKYGFGNFEEWGGTSSNDNLFVQLPGTMSRDRANQILADFTQANFKDRGNNDKKAFFLSPLSDMHFDDRFENFSHKIISRSKLSGIGLVGILIILMACINFINISTAIITHRMKEVGVRKTLGSGKKHLAIQFLTETSLLVFFSLLAGMIIAFAGKTWLTRLFDFPETFNLFSNPYLIPFLLVLWIVISVFAGIYPAWVMSGFSPLEAFRSGRRSSWRNGFSFRKVLIVFQFSVAIVLIFSTIINFAQLQMLQKADMGYVKEGVYTFSIDPEMSNRYESFRNELNRVPGIKFVSFSSDNPSSGNNWQSNFSFDGSPEDAKFNISLKFADGNYFDTYGLRLIAGRKYDGNDTNRRYLVNETLLAKLGAIAPADAIGKQLKLGGSTPGTIIGVVKDFQTESAHEANSPILILPNQEYEWTCGVKIESANLNATASAIQKIYNQVFPEYAFNGRFYEDDLNEYYKADNQLGLMYKAASALAILIACLGLFGMAAFMAEQRKKEIGIRKVVGAGVSHIVGMISRDFIILVAISVLIGFPLAYYLSGIWLENFVIRVPLSWVYFFATGMLALVIAVLSVGYHALSAALANPVRSLRSE